MGLGLRIASAKRAGLVFAGLLWLASPAPAAPLTPPSLCPTTATTASVTATGDAAVAGDQAYIVGSPSAGLYFSDDFFSPSDSVSVISNGVTIDATGTSNPGIRIVGAFDSICYDGQSGSIVADASGIAVNELSDGDVLLAIAHAIQSNNHIGIEVAHAGDGRIDIATTDVTGPFAGISVIRIDDGDLPDTGNDISIKVSGTVTSDGRGIVVDTSTAGDIEIETHDVDAGDAGILVQRSSLADGDTVVTAKGAIGSSSAPGIGVFTAANGDVTIGTEDNVTSTDAGIAVIHSGAQGDISISTAAGSEISAHGGTGLDIYVPGFDLQLPVGIYVDRSGADPGARIDIHNDADIGAEGMGIYVDICSCGESVIDIQSTGTITVDDGSGSAAHFGAGIYVSQGNDGNVTVNQSGHVAVAEGVGIVVDHYGDGDISAAATGGLESTDVGLAVNHLGLGNVSLTAAGTYDITDGWGIDVAHLGTGTVDVTSRATINSAFDAIVVEHNTGNTTISQTGALTVTDGAGIVVDQIGDGNVVVDMTGNITATLTGIGVSHYGDTGTVEITTSPGSTVTATGTSGGFGIGVDRATFGPGTGTGGIVIDSGANLVADAVGIYAEACGCVIADIDIASSGNITAPYGIIAMTTGAASLHQTAGTITGTNGITLNAATTIASIAAGARIAVTGSGTGRNGASFTGATDLTVGGTIDAAGTDALLFTGGNARLTLLPGFVINGQVDAEVAQSNDLLFGGASGMGAFDLDRLGTGFTGFDTFTKTGNSSWTFSGSSFSGLLTATAGTVVINSDIPGLDLVLDNTTFHGNAGLDSLTMTGGTLAPGNSIGLITVAGDASIGAGTVYGVEVNAAGAGDKLEAGGTVTIDPTARVLATMEPGTYGAVTTYTIITGTTAVSGAFGGVASGSAFYDAALTYDPNNAYLVLTRNSLILTDFAKTPNQIATAAALDGAGTGAPYFDELFVLPAGAVPDALDSLSGDGYASLSSAAMDDARFVRDAALDRRGARGIWSTPYGGISHLPGDGNGPAVDQATGGLLLGADGPVGDGYLGLLLGYGQSRYAIPDRDMSAASGEFSLGSYGGTDWNQFYAGFGAAITGRDVDATRAVVFPGVDDTFRAQYASLTAQAFGELGLRLEMGATTVTPFGGLAGLQSATSGYTETGSGAGALTVDPSTASALVTTLGLRVEHEIAVSDGATLTIRATAAWRHAMGRASTSNSIAGTSAFSVTGAPLAADSLSVKAGAALQMGQLAVGLDYTGSFGSGAASYATTATLAGQF